MKLIIGSSGEGKTQRMVELASELARTKSTSTIYTFEDSPVDLAGRIVKYMNDNGIIEGRKLIEVEFLDKIGEVELIQKIKETRTDLIFFDGLTPYKIDGRYEDTIIDLFNMISKVERKSKKGIFLTAQRMPMATKEGINVIDYGVVENE
jgi:hypothetical protein